jgi:hypothetical protein
VVVNCRPCNSEGRVQSQVNLCGICGGQSGSGAGFLLEISFSLSVSFDLCHIHVRFICCRCCKMFFSQYFSFPPSVSFLHRSVFIHLPQTLCNIFLPVLQFPLSVSFHHCSILIHSSTTDAAKCFSPSTSVSPVSIIPPLLHTHSSIYHRRCIMFFSQYFSFPCQYHSTIAPYSFIHLPPTLRNVFLPVLSNSQRFL